MAYNIDKYPLHWALGGADTSGGLEQNAYELQQLCNFIKEADIRTYLELGIAQGYLLRFMKDEMKLKVKGVTLDKYPTHEGLDVTYGKSQDIEIADSYDMIFVDGDHSYEAVKTDYEKFKGKCSFMAFHDICGHRACEGVKKLWSEIKDKYEHWSLIAENKEQQSGIGIIWIGQKK
ncbi:MAG: class I SAM-dependent methyltransferase [Acidiferrobacterales bacterium]